MAVRNNVNCFHGIFSHTSSWNHDYRSKHLLFRTLATVHTKNFSNLHNPRSELFIRQNIILTPQAVVPVSPQENVIYSEVNNDNKVNYNSFGKVTASKSTRLMRSNTTIFPDGYFLNYDEQSNNNFLSHHCQNGKLVEACHLIDVMARYGQIPDFECSVNLIRGLVNVERVEKVGKVLKVMVMSGGIPDIITYNKLIGGFCKRGQLSSAIDLVEVMSFTGCPPDVITFNTLFRCMFNERKQLVLEKSFEKRLSSISHLLHGVSRTCLQTLWGFYSYEGFRGYDT